ncbi:MAG: hypothetical protein VX007_11790 [Pseudomonadota bacterium]|nr:hypothetical protein [Pseudomonadota bacterium]
MSDENETNNPYQPPAPSDETLAKKDAAKTKAKLNPVHWLVPIFGYAYVPAIFIVASLPDYAISLRILGFLGTADDNAMVLAVYIIYVLPVYVVVILFLGWRRHRQGTNTTGMKLYHGLSLILPTLWFAFIFWVAWSGAMV